MSRLLPPVLIERDASGTTFMILERRDVPLAFASLCSPGGLSVQGAPGLQHITTALLNQGSDRIDAQEWRRRLDREAIGLSLWASETFWAMSADGLGEDFELGLGMMADLAGSPRMPRSEWSRLVKSHETNAREAWQQPWHVVGWLTRVQNLGFGHPNASPATIGAFQKLSFDAAFKEGRSAFGYGPGAAVIAGGDIDASKTLSRLKARFSVLPPARTLNPRPPSPSRSSTWVIDKKTSQAFFTLSRPGVRRGEPHRSVLNIANRALGEGFSSRLFTSVRETFGQTYHISSHLPMNHHDNPFCISSFTDAANFGTMIEHIQKTLRQVVEQGLTEEEVSAAREYCFGSLPLKLTSPAAVLWHVFDGWESNLAPQQLEAEWQGMRDVSRDEVNAALRRILGDLTFRLTVLGPWDVLKPQLGGRPGVEIISAANVGKAQYWPG